MGTYSSASMFVAVGSSLHRDGEKMVTMAGWSCFGNGMLWKSI